MGRLSVACAGHGPGSSAVSGRRLKQPFRFNPAMLWLVSGLRQKATADGQQLPRSGYAGGLRTGCWLVETALPDRRAGDVQPGNLVPGSTRMFCPVSWWNPLFPMLYAVGGTRNQFPAGFQLKSLDSKVFYVVSICFSPRKTSKTIIKRSIWSGARGGN